MSQDDASNRVHDHAVRMVLNKYGRLDDLPIAIRQVMWVTAYRVSEISLKIRDAGGGMALLKSRLLDGGKDALRFEQATATIKFLDQMVPVVRSHEDPRARASDMQLLEDTLKWGMHNAYRTPSLIRSILRRFAKCDPMYGSSVPSELVSASKRS